MARRPFILVAGQSNATPVADAQSWEDEHLTIALRSPRNPVSSAQQFSRASGTSSDKITLPITFAGAPQQGQFGDYFDRGTWQIADCQGKAIQQLRLLTFYNPTPSYLNLGTGTTQTFPGVGEVGFFSTGRIINSSVRWHYSPNGKTITRLRTGVVHTINHSLGYTIDAATDIITIAAAAFPKDKHRFVTGDLIHFHGTDAGGGLAVDTAYYAIKVTDTTFKVASTEANAKAEVALNLTVAAISSCTVHLGGPIPSSTFSVYPPFVPPPEPGEQFSYPIWDPGSAPNPSTTSLLNVGPNFGGLHDLGSTQDAAPYAASAGAHYAKLRKIDTAVGVPGPSRVSMKSRPVMPGQAIQFGSGGVELGGSIKGWDLGTNRLTALHWTAVPGVYHTRMGDGTPIQLLATGVIPTPLSAGPTYYIRNSTYSGGVDSFQLSESIDGPIIDLTAGVFTTDVGTLPVLSDVYYVTRIVDTEETVSGGVFAGTPTNTITFGSAHGLTNGERVRLSADTFPGPGADGVLNSTTDYYVLVQSPTVIALCISEPRLLKFNSTADVDTGANTITIAGHGLANGTKLRMSDTLPTGLAPATDYYVINATTNTFKVSLFPGLGEVDITATAVGYATINTGIAFDFGTAGSSVTITRKEWYAHFYFSAEPGGTEIELAGDSGTAMSCYVLQSFRGSLTGLKLNCLTGANAGQTRDLSDVYIGGSPLRAILRLATPLSSTPTLNDTYSITPPPHNGADVPYDKFALWLPWSPFEGLAYQYGPVASSVSEVQNGDCFIDTNGGAILSIGDVVRIYSSGRLPSIFEPGKRYYVTAVGLGGASAFLSATYGGANIIGVTTDNGDIGRHVITVERQRGRTNPFPPGFNYPNQLQIIGSYQPFDGQALLGPPKQVFYTGLGIRLAEYLGEPVYVAACAFGGTGIGHREVSTASGVSYGALDNSQQMSWDPGEPNGCFARLLATLDAAKIAFERQGDTGECIGIWWVQGEEDATYEDQANRYYENATKLRVAIRQAIKDRDLCSIPAAQIRWIQPLPQTTFGQYYDTVRAAIVRMVDEDQYSATHELTDLERVNLVTDPYHYSGAGMTEFERRSYEAWIGLQRNTAGAVTLCNLALSYIGNKAAITSIDPPDGSVEAGLCASFYDIAVRAVLRMHPWSFATEKTALVAVNDGNGDNDDAAYVYRYEVPRDCVQPLAIVAAEATNDHLVGGVKVPADFVLKRSPTDKAQRIYTNQEDAWLRYVVFENDPNQWDPLFGLAFTWHLASMLAGALIKTQEGDQAATRCLNRMAQYLAEAKKADFQERQVTLDERSRYSRAR